MKQDASADAIMAMKNAIVHSIQDDMATNDYSNLARIVFVGEHSVEHEPIGIVSNFGDSEDPSNSSFTTYVAIAIALLATLFGIVAVVNVKRKRKREDVCPVEAMKKEDKLGASTVGCTARVTLIDEGFPVVEEVFGEEKLSDSSTMSDGTLSTNIVIVTSDEDTQSLTKSCCRDDSSEGSINNDISLTMSEKSLSKDDVSSALECKLDVEDKLNEFGSVSSSSYKVPAKSRPKDASKVILLEEDQLIAADNTSSSDTATGNLEEVDSDDVNLLPITKSCIDENSVEGIIYDCAASKVLTKLPSKDLPKE